VHHTNEGHRRQVYLCATAVGDVLAAGLATVLATGLAVRTVAVCVHAVAVRVGAVA